MSADQRIATLEKTVERQQKLLELAKRRLFDVKAGRIGITQMGECWEVAELIQDALMLPVEVQS